MSALAVLAVVYLCARGLAEWVETNRYGSAREAVHDERIET